MAGMDHNILKPHLITMVNLAHHLTTLKVHFSEPHKNIYLKINVYIEMLHYWFLN